MVRLGKAFIHHDGKACNSFIHLDYAQAKMSVRYSLRSANVDLTERDKHRLEIIEAVIDGRMKVKVAARDLTRSERQIYRLMAKVKRLGSAGVIHGRRKKPPANKIAQEVWDEVLNLARTRYKNLSNHHLHEALVRIHRIRIGRESLRKRLRAAGIGARTTLRREYKNT